MVNKAVELYLRCFCSEQPQKWSQWICWAEYWYNTTYNSSIGMNKLKFLHGIGYGENILTMKVLSSLHGTDQELQERFDCLLRMGIEFSRLCLMIRTAPKILNQKSEILEQKVNFLCWEIGSSLQYLDIFPAFLCFDLEKRMKPRYRFHMWLKKKGLCSRDYSIASIMATSEKNFVARIFGFHPAAPKHWFESFSYRTTHN